MASLILTVAIAALAFLCLALACRLASVEKRTRVLLRALTDRTADVERDVKALMDWADTFPTEEEGTRGEYDRFFAQGLENLTNYSVDVAMKGGGDDR